MARFSSDSDFVNIATDERFVQALQEVDVLSYLEGRLEDYFTVVRDVRGRQEIATVTPSEKYTTKYQGDEPTYNDIEVPFIKQVINPVDASLRYRQGYSKYRRKWQDWLVGDQGNSTSFVASQVFDFTVDEAVKAWFSDVMRAIVHGRGGGQSSGRVGATVSNNIPSVPALTGGTTVAKNANQGNILKDSSEVKYYDFPEFGLIESIKDWNRNRSTNGLANNFISLSKNGADQPTGRGTNGQYNLASDYAKNLIDELVLETDIDIDFNIILCNTALYNNYARSLASNNNLQSNEDRFLRGEGRQNNSGALDALGYPLTRIKRYDAHREKDFTRTYPSSLSHTDTPHFLLLADKNTLKVYLDPQAALNNLRVTFPDGEKEYVYIKGDYKVDFKFTAPVAGGFRCAI